MLKAASKKGPKPSEKAMQHLINLWGELLQRGIARQKNFPGTPPVR